MSFLSIAIGFTVSQRREEFEEAVAETLHDVSEVVFFLVGALTEPWAESHWMETGRDERGDPGMESDNKMA